MVPSLWDLLDLVCKFLTYLGAASLVGTLFCLWLFKNESSQLSDDLLVYMAGGSFLGFQGALLRFFVQVGMVVDDGLIVWSGLRFIQIGHPWTISLFSCGQTHWFWPLIWP